LAGSIGATAPGESLQRAIWETARVSAAAPLRAIEPHIRNEAPPDEAVLVIRGGPLTMEKIVAHAARQMLEYSFQGRPMFSVSADLTIGAWTIEEILRTRLWSRSTYATTTVGTLRTHGYVSLPTFAAPHCDIVLPTATSAAARALLAHFGPTHDNPYKRRR